MSSRTATRSAAIVIGAGLGIAAASVVHGSSSPVALRASAAGLVAAAGAYPLARSDRGWPVLSEAAALLLAASVVGESLRDPGGAAKLVGFGWIGHAVFDALFGERQIGRLPAWYPALCAGYDLAFGGVLISGRSVRGY